MMKILPLAAAALCLAASSFTYAQDSNGVFGPPGMPTNLSPAPAAGPNGEPGTYANANGRIPFRWDAAENAETYYLWVARLRPGQTPVIYENNAIPVTRCNAAGRCTFVPPITFMDGEDIIWWVGGQNPDGLVWAPSANEGISLRFLISNTPPEAVLASDLYKPKGNYPLTTDATLTPNGVRQVFEWERSPLASSYQLQVANVVTGQVVYLKTFSLAETAAMCGERTGLYDTCEFMIPTADINFADAANTDYCWQVRAVNGAGSAPATALSPTNAGATRIVPGLNNRFACFARQDN